MPEMRFALYPTELSDQEWAILAPLLPPAKPGGRPRTVDLRAVLNGIFYVLRSGCQWRLLPREYGPWSTVYAYFRRWRLAGVWERIHTTLRERVRQAAGRLPTPSAAIIDSQSVKTTERGGPHGYDGAKKLYGRKRHLLVDTLGLVQSVRVHPADLQDRAGARQLLPTLKTTLPRLELIWADSAYGGPLQTWVRETLGWRVQIVARPGGINAGIKFTKIAETKVADPSLGLRSWKMVKIPREAQMLRSRLVHSIHDLRDQGRTVSEIARSLGISRPTVRKYWDGARPAKARQPKPSKLDPYTVQVRQWVEHDHCTNCVSMFTRLRALGYTGGVSQLKAFVHPLRPAHVGKRPVIRYETPPGEQLQFDWGEFAYEAAGVAHKVFGFVAILSYSRMRFAYFTKRADAPTLIRCLMAAFECFGGLPRSVLTDRMKSVLLGVEDGQCKWHAGFSDFVASLGVTPRVCKPYTPQTKGKVERTVGVLKTSFWPGVTFTDLDDLNAQACA